MNAAIPPCRCASAMMCRQTVVLPEPSGPNTSITRPRGMPPTPSAMSSANDPVGIVPKPPAIGCSPNFITAPLPCCFSICWSVTSSILSRSTRSPFRSRPTPEEGRVSTLDERSSTLATGSDISYTPVIQPCGDGADVRKASRTDVRAQAGRPAPESDSPRAVRRGRVVMLARGRETGDEPARDMPHRAHDPVVPRAAAEVPGQADPDLLVTRFRVVAEQRRRRNEHPGRAETALDPPFDEERRLQRAQCLPVGETLDGRHLPARGL